MIISWNWLKDYLDLTASADEVVHRLAMSGLNHESTTPHGDDLAIDLEVTSNRPDCLGHLGIAREVAVLWRIPMKRPEARPPSSGPAVKSLAKVRIDCPELCSRYMARVIRGVKIAASPSWLANRLQTVGIQPVNNVVDISNYVMWECGQPLHTFDFGQLAGREIVVRQAVAGEEFLAIDHRTYRLEPGMCVIADRDRSVALGGVMGGATSEVAPGTTEILVEAASFSPLSVRTTARTLNLHSPSSYRFERGIDVDGIDWASRRCCELILELAGGELADGVLDVCRGERRLIQPIRLRLSQIPRVLGIEIDREEVRGTLIALGFTEIVNQPAGSANRRQPDMAADTLTFVPPSWRADVTREIDTIEEVARIHGYDAVPDNVPVPQFASQRTDQDRALSRIRRVVTAAGMLETVTASVVPREWTESFQPWSTSAAMHTLAPLLRGADALRQSLIPSLLSARRDNENAGNEGIELFETAKVYLPRPDRLPDEPWMLGMCSQRSFLELKGILETVLDQLRPGAQWCVRRASRQLLEPTRCVELQLDDRLCGYLGELDSAGRKRFDVQGATTVAELRLEVLTQTVTFVPQHTAVSHLPAIDRDLNLIVPEPTAWSDLARLITSEADSLLERIAYQETYRDPQRDGPDRKRVLLSLRFRGSQRTLTSDEVDACCASIVRACARDFQARLVQ